MYILKADGTTKEIEGTSLEAMQEAVGGDIEIIGTKDGRLMVINEEGKLKRLPLNKTATSMAHIYSDDYIVGDVIIAEESEID